jgi:hypothetical protein
MSLKERLRKLEEKKGGEIKVDIVDDFGDGVYRYQGEVFRSLEELPSIPPDAFRFINEFM